MYINESELKEADLIFISIANPLYRRVEIGTGSKASHVGILLKDKDQNWIVAESTIPFSKYTPLKQFISRSDKGWYCIRRVKTDLASHDIKKIHEQCNKRMGILYHTGFKYDSRRQFCSKFVYDVFRSAIDIEVGDIETFKELLNKQPNTSTSFWRFWFFGFIPWSRRTVTPASQMDSNMLVPIKC